MIEFDIFKARQCPKCGSRDYRRSITASIITTVVNGKRNTKLVRTDAGNFSCLKCDFSEDA